MNLTDLEIGQFATRNWYDSNKTLCVKRCSQNSYEYWKRKSFSERVSQSSSIFNHNDFELCDCNGNIIQEQVYPLYMENIAEKSTNGRVIKFVSLNEGTVILQGNSTSKVGESCSCWIKHTNTKHWKPCDFSKAPEIEDLDYWDARFKAGLPVYFSFNSNNNDTIYRLFDAPSIAFCEDMRFHISDETKLKPEFNYPMYFECINNHCNKGMIVKFTELDKGLLVKEAKNGSINMIKTSREWTKHTDQKSWKQVNFDETIGKIIPDEDDIDELISDLKSIIKDDDNRFSQSESTLPDNELNEPIIGVDYASQPDFTFVPQDAIKSKLIDDNFDALSYAKCMCGIYQQDTGATEVANNLNQTKEFTMTKELQDAILELIATNGKPKVKKPKTPKIVCDVNGELMRFVDEAELKSFMWSSRIESVIRYDLSGKVTVPFELSVEAPKTKASKSKNATCAAN